VTKDGRLRIPAQAGEHRIQASPIAGLDPHRNSSSRSVHRPPARLDIPGTSQAEHAAPAEARLSFVAAQEHVGARVFVGDRQVERSRSRGLSTQPVGPVDSETDGPPGEESAPLRSGPQAVHPRVCHRQPDWPTRIRFAPSAGNGGRALLRDPTRIRSSKVARAGNRGYLTIAGACP